MNDLAYRWGVLVSRHRTAMLVGWLLVVIVGATGFSVTGRYLPPADVSVPGSDAAVVAQLSRDKFPLLGAEQDMIVFDSADRTVDDPEYRRVIADASDVVRGTAGVGTVVDPFASVDPLHLPRISADRRSAFTLIVLNQVGAHDRARLAASLQSRLTGLSAGAVRVSLTGYSAATNDLATVERNDTARAESIGLPIALLVLVLSFGAVVAAAVPLIVAGAGLATAFGVIALLMPTMHFSVLVVTVATTLGTGIGIDYSLFVVSRFREELARRGITDRGDTAGIAAAVGTTMATAGITITISALVVVITLAALLLVNSPVFHEITVGISATVFSLLAVAVSVLPAVLAMLGPRVNRGALPAWARPSDAAAGTVDAANRWTRWAQRVMRRPWRYGLLVVAALLLAAIPVGGLRYGLNLGGQALADTESGRANAVLAQKFTPGLLGPIQIAYTAADHGPMNAENMQRAEHLATRVATHAHITATSTYPADGYLLQVAVSDLPVDSAAATDLVSDLRRIATTDPDDPTMLVGGTTAQFLDLTHETQHKTAAVIALVLGLSLLFLSLVFASVAIPVKAVLVNLLVTAASVGLTILIFQSGYGHRLLGFTPVGYLQVYLPVTVFVMLFGLSMDYEVFLLARIREAWRRRADEPDAAERNRAAVGEGLTHSARPISAAAAIMAAILLSMLTADVLELKQFGFSLATAILIDAVLVRLMLVPAAMAVLGRWNWWPGSAIESRRQRTEPAPAPSISTS
ncbi:MMPL family transporter [Nocardia sp. NBC_01499]|uniref:MMPL family transporter n=1 Tax=Nocardia sp. NBC_01499 TaxID=2903597 RepID=UPI00386319A7